MMAAAAATKRGRRGRKRSARPPPPPPPPPTSPPVAEEEEDEPRRTLRPRRHRPLLLGDFANFDDYLVDDEDLLEGSVRGDEEQEKKRRNLKLVLRLPRSPVGKRRDGGAAGRAPRFGSPPVARESWHRRPEQASPAEASSPSSASSSSYADAGKDEDEEVKPPKKRRFDGSDDAGGSDEETRRENVVPRRIGVSTSSTTVTSLPERKILEAIPDKLQKKDIYGAFAHPVDSEELPDYREVIEHPMDYGTIRKKLARNAYRSLEQFEARSMQDIGRKEFQKLRSEFKCIEFDRETEEKTRTKSVERKPVQNVLPKKFQEPLGSEISSATTLASVGDASTLLSAPPATSVGPDLHAAINGLADGNSSLEESKSEKLDELSVKDSPSKFERRSLMVDENRRATYNMCEQQPVIESELVLDILEDESRQLIAVEAEAEYPYARSLARFAASLGPIGWKIASQRIESVLPTGVKFGPGWVGEYEPLPTPILSLEKHHQQKPEAESSMQLKMDLKKCHDDLRSRTNSLNYSKDERSNDQSQVHVRSSYSDSDIVKQGNGQSRTTEPMQQFSIDAPKSQLGVTSTKLQHQRGQVTMNFTHTNSKALQQVGFCHPSSLDSPVVNIPTQRPDTLLFNKRSLQPELQKQAVALKVKPEALGPCTTADGLGRNSNEATNLRVSGTSSSDSMSNITSFISKHQPVMLGKWHTPSTYERDIIDNSKLMGFQNKEIIQSNNSDKATKSPRPFPLSVPPTGRESPSSAAAVAARAWMSVGSLSQCNPSADNMNRQNGSTSLYGSVWTTPNSSPRNAENAKMLPSQAFRLPVQMVGYEPPVQNNGLVIFPQAVSTGLSRFHSPTSWQGLVPQMQKHNKICPPDLNISFQPPESPVPQSSSIMKDSQQPDLALQL